MGERTNIFKATVESRLKEVKGNGCCKIDQCKTSMQPKGFSKTGKRKKANKQSLTDERQQMTAIPCGQLETRLSGNDVPNSLVHETEESTQQIRMRRLEKLMNDLNLEIQFGLYKCSLNKSSDSETDSGEKSISTFVKTNEHIEIPKRTKKRLCEKRQKRAISKSSSLQTNKRNRKNGLTQSKLKETDAECCPRKICLKESENYNCNCAIHSATSKTGTYMQDVSHNKCYQMHAKVKTPKKKKTKMLLNNVASNLPTVRQEVEDLASKIFNSNSNNPTNRPEFFKVAMRNLEYQINDLKLRLTDRDAFGKIIQLESELKQIQRHILSSADIESSNQYEQMRPSYQLYDDVEDYSNSSYIKSWMEKNDYEPQEVMAEITRLNNKLNEDANSKKTMKEALREYRMPEMEEIAKEEVEKPVVINNQPDVGSKLTSNTLIYPANVRRHDTSTNTADTSATRTSNDYVQRKGTLIMESDITFQQTDIIGNDAFAIVFRGKFSNNDVAIKQLRSALSSQDTNYFLSEASLLCDVHHPCVVHVYGACVSTVLPLLVLEYVGGGTLYHRLMDNSKPAFDFNTYFQIATDIARGLKYLHQHQPIILHLDLTSRSILLTSSNRAKITDFGFSKLRHDAVCARSFNSAFSDSLAWMAPELIDQGAISPRADVYSYALLLWQMLSRNELYVGLSTYEVLEAVRRGLRPQLAENFLPILRDLIANCWHQNSALRLSVKDILKTLAFGQSRPMEMFRGKAPNEYIPNYYETNNTHIFSDTDISDEEVSHYKNESNTSNFTKVNSQDVNRKLVKSSHSDRWADYNDENIHKFQTNMHYQEKNSIPPKHPSLGDDTSSGTIRDKHLITKSNSYDPDYTVQNYSMKKNGTVKETGCANNILTDDERISFPDKKEIKRHVSRRTTHGTSYVEQYCHPNGSVLLSNYENIGQRKSPSDDNDENNPTKKEIKKAGSLDSMKVRQDNSLPVFDKIESNRVPEKTSRRRMERDDKSSANNAQHHDIHSASQGDMWIDEMIARFASQLEKHRLSNYSSENSLGEVSNRPNEEDESIKNSRLSLNSDGYRPADDSASTSGKLKETNEHITNVPADHAKFTLAIDSHSEKKMNFDESARNWKEKSKPIDYDLSKINDNNRQTNFLTGKSYNYVSGDNFNYQNISQHHQLPPEDILIHQHDFKLHQLSSGDNLKNQRDLQHHQFLVESNSHPDNSHQRFISEENCDAAFSVNRHSSHIETNSTGFSNPVLGSDNAIASKPPAYWTPKTSSSSTHMQAQWQIKTNQVNC